MFLPHPHVKVSIVGSLRDQEVACSASDRQGSNFESCVWRTVSSQSSHHPQEVLLAQFSLYVHKGGLKPDSFILPRRIVINYGLFIYMILLQFICLINLTVHIISFHTFYVLLITFLSVFFDAVLVNFFYNFRQAATMSTAVSAHARLGSTDKHQSRMGLTLYGIDWYMF